MTRSAIVLLGVGLAASLVRPALPGAPAPPDRPREPVALALSADGRRVFAADRRGRVSVIDAGERPRVSGTADVGTRLADLARLPDGRLLAVDEGAAELLVLAADGDSLTP